MTYEEALKTTKEILNHALGHFLEDCANSTVFRDHMIEAGGLFKQSIYEALKGEEQMTIDELTKHHTYQQAEKPPLGLTPRRVVSQLRAKEIILAIERYSKAARPIPEEWIAELKELTEEFIGGKLFSE